MNIHKNARLTFARRLEMVHDVLERGLTLIATASTYGVSTPTVRKWSGRYVMQGRAGLLDRSSRPARSPRAIAPEVAQQIVDLRRRRLTQARIARSANVSASTVSRVLARVGLSRLADLEPSEPLVRYEHAHPGDLLHIDTKSSAGSSGWAIALPAIHATTPTAPDGNSCSSRSMTTRASALPR